MEAWEQFADVCAAVSRGEPHEDALRALKEEVEGREFVMLVSGRLARCCGEKEWVWLVDQLGEALQALPRRKRSKISPSAVALLCSTYRAAASSQPQIDAAADSDDDDSDAAPEARLHLDAEAATRAGLLVARGLLDDVGGADDDGAALRCTAVATVVAMAKCDAFFGGCTREALDICAAAGAPLQVLADYASLWRHRRSGAAARKRSARHKEWRHHVTRDVALGGDGKTEFRESGSSADSASPPSSSHEDDAEEDEDEDEPEEEEAYDGAAPPRWPKAVEFDTALGGVAALGALRGRGRRWSATGAARLVARAVCASLEPREAPSVPSVWSAAFTWHTLGPAGLRLLSRRIRARECLGAPADGAALIDALLRRPLTRLSDGAAPDGGDAARHDPWERRLAKRLARAVAFCADAQARRAARAALRKLLAPRGALSGSGGNGRVFETLRFLLDDAHLCGFGADQGRAAGVLLDCVRACVSTDFDAEADSLVAETLEMRLKRLCDDADAGYDALHERLDAHLAAVALGRAVALARVQPTPCRAAEVLRALAAGRLGAVAETLRRRLRRCEAAAAADDAPPEARSGAFVSAPPVPPQQPDQQRFLLHLLSENLDYALQLAAPAIEDQKPT